MKLTAGALAGAMIALIATSSDAHHAFSAEFDQNKPVELEGTVARVEWINPHGWIHVAVADDEGNETVWMVEMGSVGTLVRRGITRDSIPIGTAVKVNGFQARNGLNRASGESITTPSGDRLIVGAAGIGAAPGSQSE
jgi:hypothetical protein